MAEIPPHKAVKALSHPIRVAILELVDDQPRSPIEIARALDKPLPRVSYHVRELHKVGALELTHTEPRRRRRPRVAARSSRCCSIGSNRLSTRSTVRLRTRRMWRRCG